MPNTQETSSAPPSPFPWHWECHKCKQTYRLAVTRRCLQDGHYFCTGTTPSKLDASPKRRKTAVCSSAFDYHGWRALGKWRRNCLTPEDAMQPKASTDKHISQMRSEGRRDCSKKCDYPSECHWKYTKPDWGKPLGLVAS